MTLEIGTVVMLFVAIINVLILGPGAWIIKGLIDDMKNLRADISALRDEVHKGFTRREDFLRSVDKIEMSIQEMRQEVLAAISKS